MKTPATIDDYIAGFPPDIQAVLQRVRETVHEAAPDATETMSYAMPTFALNKAIVHFGAFKGHIGLYPPVRDPALQTEVLPYKGEKGNLRFPLDQPIPYALIGAIVKSRVDAMR